jgi:F-type H+-transporting ATPase subunit beta
MQLMVWELPKTGENGMSIHRQAQIRRLSTSQVLFTVLKYDLVSLTQGEKLLFGGAGVGKTVLIQS